MKKTKDKAKKKKAGKKATLLGGAAKSIKNLPAQRSQPSVWATSPSA